jgi:hypothetical protein
MAWFRNLKELLGLQRYNNALCMVVSEQEGAEIWLEGKKLALVTPAMVAIPKNQDVIITVKQIGHEPHVERVRTAHSLSYFYCDLKRIPLRVIGENQLSSF